MAMSLTTMAGLRADSPAPAIDMDDLRLDPLAREIDEDGDTLRVARERDGKTYWLAQNPAGRRREVNGTGAYYLNPHVPPPVIRVFLSSTFRDMAVERDHLIKTVFPRLKRLAQQHGITLQEIDLRWGVTEQQVQRGETVAICLDEIDRCRGYPPFFIGMLGERYGWVPEGAALAALDQHLAERGAHLRQRAQMQALSVTEMEIRYGVLDQPADQRRAFFYHRAPALTTLLAQQTAHGDQVYYSPEHDGMQARLKADLVANHLLRIDGYCSVIELGEDIERMLSAAILRLAKTQYRVVAQTLSAMPDGVEYNQQIDADLKAEYIELERNQQLAMAAGPYGPDGRTVLQQLLLLGESGSGKRSVARQLMPSFCDFSLHCRNGAIRDTDSACRYIRSALVAITGAPTWYGPPRERFVDMLQTLAAPVTLYITDIDLLDDGQHLLKLLGQADNTRIYLIATASDPAYARLAGRLTVHRLGALGTQDRHSFIVDYLARYRKTLDAASSARIAAMPLAGSPSFLKLVLEELRRDAVFETLGAVIDVYARFDTLEQAYDHALSTWLRHIDEDGLQHDGWRRALQALCSATRGVPEAFFTAPDGADLPPLSWAIWRGLAAGVMVEAGQGWQLRDASIRRAVQRRYGPPRR